MNRIVARIKGGLGNQLFCYAAARRLALANNAELLIDNVSGFARDRQYGRKYALDYFNIPVRKATPAERMEPFERYRRGVMKWLSRKKPFASRRYLEQEGLDFDERLLALKVEGTLYLDGYWQSEDYFKDVEQTIREDLRIIPPTDAFNQHMAEEIRTSQAVTLHVRWHDSPDCIATNDVSADYYHHAIALMQRQVESPRYFLFSDDPEAARTKLHLPESRVTFVSQNRGDCISHNQGFDENAIADLWLMTQCKHFIIANSTFSWWGAWLGEREAQTVVCPSMKITDKNSITAWNFAGHLPNRWIKL